MFKVLPPFLLLVQVAATPHHNLLSGPKRYGNGVFFDLQAHRGGRANAIENTLPSFAWGLIEGATTLELDNGITKDEEVVIWHDEEISSTKCRDTQPAFPDDPEYPYVGKFIANLTLSQIKTLDCSRRQPGFPLQLSYPGTRISTLRELFDFLDCADPEHRILLNIESKVDAVYPNHTASVNAFVQRQYESFLSSGYFNSITYQSFDWRTLIAMKSLDSTITTSALIVDSTIAVPEGNTVSPWLAGIDLSHFNGSTLSDRVVQAAASIGADILSPSATSESSKALDPEDDGYVPFTTSGMVACAHELGLLVKPWTVNHLNIVEKLIEYQVDGIITDSPDALRRWAQQKKLSVAPRFPKYRVLACLEKYNQPI